MMDLKTLAYIEFSRTPATLAVLKCNHTKAEKAYIYTVDVLRLF